MTTLRSLLVALAVPLALAGCSGGTTSRPQGADSYDIKGKVTDLAPAKAAVQAVHQTAADWLSCPHLFTPARLFTWRAPARQPIRPRSAGS